MPRFSDEQIAKLEAKLSSENVSQLKKGKELTLSYVEGWHVINEANRIFGFGAWSSDIERLDCVVNARQGEPNYNNNGYLISYVATVRVTVHHEDGPQLHSDVGYGEGINYGNAGQAHESAIKEAVTDAYKRALRHWGNPFGLALYDKEQRDVETVAVQPTSAPRKPRPSSDNPTWPTDDRAAEPKMSLAQFVIRCREGGLSDDERHDLLSSVTDGRISSSKEATQAELLTALKRLETDLRTEAGALLRQVSDDKNAALAAIRTQDESLRTNPNFWGIKEWRTARDAAAKLLANNET